MKNIIFAFISVLIIGTTVYGQKKTIDFERLPEDAKTFVKTNFPNETVLSVTIETTMFDTEYEVRLSDNTKIDFEKDGKWDNVKNKIHCLPTGFLHADIRNYLDAKHPGNCVKEVERGRHKIKVEIANDIELIFNDNGTFITYSD
ncbi:MAG: PepSY-like domain-containing protein [Candidatus Limimorpha sp.]